MSKTYKPSELDTAIQEVLDAYASDVISGVKSAVDKTATQVKNDIKANAPVRTGKYKSSWTTKKVSESTTSIDRIVYSSNRYQIAHLLENGHAKRNGGRVKAYPHIAPAEQAGIETLESLIESVIKG